MKRSDAVTSFCWIVIISIIAFIEGFTLSMTGDPPGLSVAVQTYAPLFTAFLQAGSLLYIGIQVNESLNDRKTLLDENAKERRVGYLTRQLEFYSKLVGKLNGVWSSSDTFQNKISQFRTRMRESGIQEEYQIWGSSNLVTTIEIFYRYYLTNTEEFQMEDEDEILIVLEDIIDTANTDFEILSTEYRQLTSIQLVNT